MSLSISSSELTPPDPAQMRDKMFKRVDTDGNGKVSQDELKALLEKRPASAAGATETAASDSTERFTQFDTDGDGELNSTELDEGMRSMGPPPPRPERAGQAENSEMFESILKTLSESDGKTSSLSDEQKEFIEKLLQELKNSGLYNAQGGAAASGATSSFFGTTA